VLYSLESMNMRLCALLETSDGEYHICCGQFSFFGDGVYFLATPAR
jgi:hypothetical protein